MAHTEIACSTLIIMVTEWVTRDAHSIEQWVFYETEVYYLLWRIHCVLTLMFFFVCCCFVERVLFLLVVLRFVSETWRCL